MARGCARLCMHTCVRVFARGSEGPCVRMGTDSHHVSQPAPHLMATSLSSWHRRIKCSQSFMTVPCALTNGETEARRGEPFV